MAITDASAIKFSNEKIRVAADKLYGAYLFAKEVITDWNAVSMSTLITNTSDVISDGSITDGRTQITGAEATSVITRLQELVTDYEASSNSKLNTVVKPSVNPR